MELPTGLQFVRSTPVFDEHSVPAGLLAAHRVSEGVWGRLVVFSGQLDFVFEDVTRAAVRNQSQRRTVGAGDVQVIPPGEPHHVEVDGPVEFHVEFHRAEAGP